ncbi:hypothetical protein [Pseudomonas rubra]|uniref:Uncharacterized protein n=1 Tax=Pseudomonas rubra TaxID=2942627 RepID=A0ABT5P5U2_9PSED|nr:hypothetical protein [Pseudomonas rubra]MDD1013661.1 hypothetical protein [Pseudomonas rubra]MDD1040020.1 hypothetical protein [Pseudomonas rubra]MDD1155974.1 hypothetical protein [Pseudomonas rubra]
MSFFNKRTLTLTLAVVALLGLPNLHAASKPAAKPAPTVKVAVLGGKFSFSLPAGFEASPLSADEQNSEGASAVGTLYANAKEKRVVMVIEKPLPEASRPGDNDDAFLDGAVTGFVDRQSAALPDFRQTGEARLNRNGLGVRRVDSTATLGGGKTLNSTFIAGSGDRMAVIQVISRSDDASGHAALAKSIAAEP